MKTKIDNKKKKDNEDQCLAWILSTSLLWCSSHVFFVSTCSWCHRDRYCSILPFIFPNLSTILHSLLSPGHHVQAIVHGTCLEEVNKNWQKIQTPSLYITIYLVGLAMLVLLNFISLTSWNQNYLIHRQSIELFTIW